MDRPVRRRRLINRRRQGDLGEASAIEWLTSVGATVLIPFGHSPDFDLVAEAHGRLLRIQVKTCTCRVANAYERWQTQLATNGGNQSWSGVAKTFDPSRFDYLFVLTGGGRRWFIPVTAIEARHSVHLGGPKYAAFEIEEGRQISQLVYGARNPTLESMSAGGVSKRPTDAVCKTVGLSPSQVRILPPPFRPRPGFRPSQYDRKLGRTGEAVLNQKRRVTLPRQACMEAGLQDGDRVRVQSDGDGRIMLERVEPPPGTSLPGHAG
jgi:PD-(D/E)XK nuclease superfamily protein/antidote-toxin recognition MazE-like antitoxin